MSNKSEKKTMTEERKYQLKPKLRFPAFRGAPGWEEKSLEKLCTINPSSEVLPESFYYIDLESVAAGELTVKNRIDRNTAPSRAQRLLKKGDIIYQVVRPYQRNNLFFDFDEKDNYVASTGYAQLRATGSEKFLYHAIHTDGFVSKVIAKCTGSNYPAINSSDLSGIRLAVPPTIDEAQKVGECLTSLDELITAHGQKLDELQAHKKGLMQGLFPREGETIPRIRFPEFVNERGWRKKEIGDVLIEVSRPVEMKDEDEYSLVIVKRRYGGIISRGRFLGKAIKVKSQFLLETDDFLISKRQIVHCACGLISGEFQGSIVSNEYSVLRARNGLNIKFFDYFSQQPSVSKSFLECSVGIVIEKMLFRIEDWMKREFFFPTIREQQKISDCLTSIDQLITARSRKLDALKAHKIGLMQQLFPPAEEVEA